MPLTPADVHNVAFSKPPIGKRGYNEDEVDAFLDLVEGELARLVEENNDLRQRVEELDQQLGEARAAVPSTNGTGFSGSTAVAAPAPPPQAPVFERAPEPVAAAPAPAPFAASPASTVDHNMQAAKVLALAQEMADRLTGEAKAESDQVTTSAKASSEKMVADATARSEQMLAEARTKSESMVSDARAKSEAALNDARSRAETLQRQAKEKADALQADSERKHTEVMATINTQRTQLEKKIDELRTFEREYRTRLKTYLEAQLQELGQRGSAAPADSSRAAAPGSFPAVGQQQGFNSSGFGGRAEQNS